ncbi:MAG TPA: pyridoxal-phosphate dependent enzyme [Sphingomicrobium sp.]|nr:pyridoxal-phosphate dependent enzyme [Sphingomicrobium sp.]
MTIHNTILGAIGNTPVVRLQHLAPEGVELFVKLESANPMGSVKDRLALGIIEAAERSGELKPGQTVVEATSGNTGLGLAMVCAAKGYPLVIVMAENFSLERRKMLRFLGAKVVLSPPWAKGTGMLAVAQKLAKDNGWFLARQFENEAGPDIHSRTTAQEIVRDFGRDGLTAWVSGFGTGGTLKGVARALREQSPGTRIILVEPENAALVGSGVGQDLDADGQPAKSHPAFHPHPMQGWSPDFISKLTRDAVDGRLIDACVGVSGDEAIDTAIQLARREGIFCGITSGATVAGAIKAARDVPPGSRILAMVPDTGERYLSTPLFGEISVEMNDAEKALLDAAMPAIAPPKPARIAPPQPITDEAARNFVADAIANNPGNVVMFAMSWCEFCWTVRKLLTAMGVPFVSIDIDTSEFRLANDVPKIRAALAETAGAPTLPQVYAGGAHLGGCMEVLDAARSGTLQQLLTESGIACNDAAVEPYDYLPNWVKPPKPVAA